MFYLYRKSDYILEDKESVYKDYNEYSLNTEWFSLRLSMLNDYDFSNVVYILYPTEWVQRYADNGIINIGVVDFFNKKRVQQTVDIGNVIIEKGTWNKENYTIKTTFYIHIREVYDRKFIYYRPHMITCSVEELFAYITIINCFLKNHSYEELNIEVLFKQKTKRAEIKDFRRLSFFSDLSFGDFVLYLYSSTLYFHSDKTYYEKYEEDMIQTFETLHFVTKNRFFHEIIKKQLKGREEICDGTYKYIVKGNVKTEGPGWITTLDDRNTPGKEIVDSDYRRDTIKKIINETKDSFPSELDIICDYLCKNNSNV